MKNIGLKPGRAKLALNRNPWIFSGALKDVRGSITPGMLVSVEDGVGNFVAYGYYNPHSQIAIRLLEWDMHNIPNESWWYEKAKSAIGLRSLLVGSDTDSFRLIFSESDGLPGVIADKFADTVVVQFSTVGALANKEPVIKAIDEVLNPACIYERVDRGMLKKEGLSPSEMPLDGFVKGSLEGSKRLQENGLLYDADILLGQKTGFYFDQRVNRARVASFASGRKCLDCFSYTGGFTLNLFNNGAKSVLSVDSSEPALKRLEENCALNGFSDYETRCQDVFTFLRNDHELYDLIILDPPKLAPGKAGKDKAMRAYKDLNMIGLKRLAPGGVLATFSCSGGIGREDLKTAVSWAVKDSGVQVRVVDSLFQAPCHPSITALPETEYLKGFILTSY